MHHKGTCLDHSCTYAIAYCKLMLHADDSFIMISDKDSKFNELKLATEPDSVNKWLIESQISLHQCYSILFATNVNVQTLQTAKLSIMELQFKQNNLEHVVYT